ncbi:uncharacterized protein LOC143203040 [Rhynchophorus ferrugineus]|uniref:uncharacterized protein LOC143203040 n=1 Tax=Rhynchophorus ferrugineus TaxID=354439 RepID=UPI003FCE88C6
MSPTWLSDMSDTDLKHIIDSLELIFFDVDGVLALTTVPIPGAGECVLKLRELNKNIGIVTNNTFSTQKELSTRLAHCGVKEEEISTPNYALLAYLKSINFSKDVYLIGSLLLRDMLTNAGYNVIVSEDIRKEPIGENFTDIVQVITDTLSICKNVGAVVLCFAINFNSQAAQVAATILNHIPDVMLLSGATDDTAPLSAKHFVVFPKYYVDGIERWTNRKCTPMAKPSDALKDLLFSKYNITDPSKVLFVGDSVTSDIAFGRSCQFKTLLVLSGTMKKDHILKGSLPEEQTPDFIASSLDELYQRLKNY